MLTGILGSSFVETAIGLIVVWLLAASLCSGVVELIGSALGFRANHLWSSLGRLLNAGTPVPRAAAAEAASLAKKAPASAPGQPFAEFVAALPGVDVASIKRVRQLDARVAAQALVVARGASGFASSQLGALVAGLPPEVQADPDRLRDWLEHWFDGEMATVRAAYRRKIRWWAAAIALPVVVIAGLDSVGLAERLYSQPAQRTLLQAEAAKLVDGAPCSAPTPTGGAAAPGSTSTTSTTSFKKQLECAQVTAAELSGLKVSLWQARPSGGPGWARAVIGIVLSWAAVLAGAPFWYAVLKRMMSLQGRGQPTPPATT